MATSAEIRNKAAKKLGLYGTGQTLRSAISADLDEAYTEVYGVLVAKELATWASTAEVPDALVEPVVSMVAAHRATQYSIPGERYQRVMRDYHGDAVLPSAVDRIREIISDDNARPTKIEYF